LWEFSREEYLKNREAMKLQEVKDDLIDEEHLFGGMTLTTKEKMEHKYKKEVYEL